MWYRNSTVVYVRWITKAVSQGTNGRSANLRRIIRGGSLRLHDVTLGQAQGQVCVKNLCPVYWSSLVAIRRKLWASGIGVND